MRILVVEDEAALQAQVKRDLEAQGYTVDATADGKEGLYLASEYPFDAAVVDIGLPGLSGLEVIRRLRSKGSKLPILVLTARGQWQDKVEGLEAGADDYLTKPAGLALIAARLRVLIRRSAALATNEIERGPLRYDLTARRAEVHGRPVHLTGREDQLLRRLLLANGMCRNRRELLEEVWGPASGADGSLVDIYLRRLRAKLAPVEIENVRGVGYRIAAVHIDAS